MLNRCQSLTLFEVLEKDETYERKDDEEVAAKVVICFCGKEHQALVDGFHPDSVDRKALNLEQRHEEAGRDQKQLGDPDQPCVVGVLFRPVVLLSILFFFV